MSWLAAATLAGAGLSFLGAKDANKEAAASSARQMEFQERMSNTAHQREVKDLRAAGLNPILSAKYGGASTPPGSQYAPENVAKDAPAAFKNAAQQYWSAKSIQSNVALQTEQINSEETRQQLDSAKAAEAQANADSIRGVEGTLGEQAIKKSKKEVQQITKNTLDIIQSTKNKKQQEQQIKLQNKKLIQETKLLRTQMPKHQYNAYLDQHPVIKAIMAIDRGLPIAQTILGAGAILEVGSRLRW